MTTGRPTEGELLRGVAALVPFVHAWNLPLNPEELREIAWAVLFHAGSDGPLAEIEDEVRRQLAGYDQANARVRQAMAKRLNEQNDEGDSGGEASGGSA